MAKKYKWCLHCEKVYEDLDTDDFLYDGVCPYCGASVLLDGWEWSTVRAVNSQYPEIPELGVFYPLHRKSKI